MTKTSLFDIQPKKEILLKDEYNVATLEDLVIIEKDISDLFLTIETSDSYLKQLEKVKNTLENNLKTNEGKEVLKVSLEHINFIYDLLGKEESYLSTEINEDNFEENVTMSLESIMDTVKAAGVAVKDTLEKIIKKIIAFFKKVWNYLFGKEKEIEAKSANALNIPDKVLELNEKITSDNTSESDREKYAKELIAVISDMPEQQRKAMVDLNLNLSTEAYVINKDDIINGEMTKELVAKLLDIRNKFRDNIIKTIPYFVLHLKGEIFTPEKHIEKTPHQLFESINTSLSICMDIVANDYKSEYIKNNSIDKMLNKEIWINDSVFQIDSTDSHLVYINTYPVGKYISLVNKKYRSKISLPGNCSLNKSGNRISTIKIDERQVEANRIIHQIKNDLKDLSGPEQITAREILRFLSDIPKFINKALIVQNSILDSMLATK